MRYRRCIAVNFVFLGIPIRTRCGTVILSFMNSLKLCHPLSPPKSTLLKAISVKFGNALSRALDTWQYRRKSTDDNVTARTHGVVLIAFVQSSTDNIDFI